MGHTKDPEGKDWRDKVNGLSLMDELIKYQSQEVEKLVKKGYSDMYPKWVEDPEFIKDMKNNMFVLFMTLGAKYFFEYASAISGKSLYEVLAKLDDETFELIATKYVETFREYRVKEKLNNVVS